jgi:hypothetical protein
MCSSVGDQRQHDTIPRCPLRVCVLAPDRKSHNRMSDSVPASEIEMYAIKKIQHSKKSVYTERCVVLTCNQ